MGSPLAFGVTGIASGTSRIAPAVISSASSGTFGSTIRTIPPLAVAPFSSPVRGFGGYKGGFSDGHRPHVEGLDPLDQIGLLGQRSPNQGGETAQEIQVAAPITSTHSRQPGAGRNFLGQFVHQLRPTGVQHLHRGHTGQSHQ